MCRATPPLPGGQQQQQERLPAGSLVHASPLTLCKPLQTSLPSPPRRIVKLVRALRKGWIKREAAPEKPAAYLIWEDDGAPALRF